ncbi:terminase large subunit [Limosilactobacillus reuteri]|uniref:terminase large subunit n=1 Tax=Limosilactobacillus reuteri TaxID=1598 RepID=UPI00081BECD0|nr:terminase TerL endonuclease subunit [Limosilactobacillus reuteri]MCH5379839.1 terminase large subunit [Limosilactobacillus reuteri]OCW63665.1 terminase [Limosilactobacillus reuteri]OCW65683.1 terminase [Limosilactobacillus reuteri]OCW66044.1 terminase [Limosilactobacillus reuteri]OCW68873.1 terminase [Limosilactobacillus reuteri]
MNKIDLTQTHDVLGAYHNIIKSNITVDKIKKKYNDPATRYAFDVLDEKLITGYLIKLAAFRHIRDLMRSEGSNFEYHYDLSEVDKILKFAAIAPNVDTGEPTALMGWQKFIFGMLFGWRDSLGMKRFTRVILSVARGQGKSYLMAIYMCYSFLIESIGLSNQDFLVTAENYDQTGKLYGYINSMLKKIIEDQSVFATLAKEDDLVLHDHTGITMRKFNNNLRPLSFNAGKYDSYHFTTAVFDEVGNIKTREGTKKIVSGQVKVPNHQYIEISTSYPDPSVPFHDEQKMIQQVMEQDFSRDGDQTLGLIWAQDSLDETMKPETWMKSNPLLYLKDQKDVLMNGLLDKRDSDMMAGTVDDFQNKNLNLWLQEATNSYLKLADIESAIVPSFDIRGRQVYIGFDYSMFSDNTAFAFVYPYQDKDGHTKWHIQQHSFIPWEKAGSIEAKEKQDGVQYRELAKKGFCTITSHPQGMINDDEVYAWLLDYIEDNKLDVIFFGYDTFNATTFVKQLETNTSLPLEPIRQRTSELKDPTKFLQRLFVESNVTRLDDQIMGKALLNAEIYEDKIGIQVDKPKATYKIDVVDAIIDALYQGMYHFEDFGIANDKSKQVDRMTAEQVKEWFESQESGLLDD